MPISRPNFVELCDELVETDEQVFEDLFAPARPVGRLEPDSTRRSTSGRRRASQRAFLRNLARGEAYSQDAPTLWDVDFRTAVAQAEMEDRERPGAYHQLAFARTDGDGAIEIDTTRPELLAGVRRPRRPSRRRALPAAVRHHGHTPLFGVEVPVLAHELADPEKGTGIAMICTFGDTTDVTWWRELQPADCGRSSAATAASSPTHRPDVRRPTRTRAIAGRTIKQAQAQVVEHARRVGRAARRAAPDHPPGQVLREGRPPARDRHAAASGTSATAAATPTCATPSSRAANELTWHPAHMQHRYANWVDGLNGDWLISRQRFFGVPLPVWYPLDADGEPRLRHTRCCPTRSCCRSTRRPTCPPATTADQRDQPDGFIGDPDVMDTWATSSLTPRSPAGGRTTPTCSAAIFPMDMRPQAHDIIRTWLFSTVVRSHLEHGVVPWQNAAISGWILDPDRKKMSKSKGNVVTPMGLFEQYGTDAVRYWAASARPGIDTAFSEDQMKVGRKLAIKLLNVTKFVLGFGDVDGDVDLATSITNPLDRSMLAKLAATSPRRPPPSTGFDYARALERTESFFWWFCDDYVELVKGRAYDSQGEDQAASARLALHTALSSLQRLFAPILPFATEEVWSWWNDGIVHRAAWPTPTGVDGDRSLIDPTIEVLTLVRRSKTEAKQSRARHGRVAHHRCTGGAARRDRAGTRRPRRRRVDRRAVARRRRPTRLRVGPGAGRVSATTLSPMAARFGVRTALAAALLVVLLGAPAAADTTTTPDTTSTTDDTTDASTTTIGPITGPAAAGGATPTRGSQVQLQPPPPPPTVPPEEVLPAESGHGRRAVYSKSLQRVWAVDENEVVIKTHRVSGKLDPLDPAPGVYTVWSRSLRTYAVHNPSITWSYMVRFAHGSNGGNIGFHEIPYQYGQPVQSVDQLGDPLSGGCVRQSTPDAIWMWEWAQLGTVVVVLP